MDLQKSYQLLQKFRLFQQKLDTTHYVMNSCYAEAYLNKIKDLSDPEVIQLYSIPFVSHLTQLLTDNLVFCENYHISVRVFFVKVLVQVCTTELYFVKIFAISSEYIKKCFKDIHSPNLNQSVRLAFLELAICLLDHDSGMDWVLTSEVWKDVITLENNKRTLLADRHVYQFVSKFIWKLNDIGDILNLNMALNVILAPIEKSGLINQDIISDEYETEICKTLLPMCQMLLAIFAEKDRIRTSSELMHCLLTERYLLNKMGLCITKLRSPEMVLICAKVSYWASMGNIFLYKPLEPGVVYSIEDLRGLFIFYYHTLKILTQRQNTKLVAEFNLACYIIWDIVWQKDSPFTDNDNKSLDMDIHMMFISLAPLTMWAIKVKNYTELMEQDIVVKTVLSLMNNVHIEHTMRATYAIRNIIYEAEPSIIQTVTQCVKLLHNLISHITDRAATLLFRCLFFVICEFNEQENNSLELRCSRSEMINMVSQVMEVLLSVMKRYNIKWNESVEVLHLYSVVHSILKKPDLPPKFVVVLLSTLSYTVSKFLTPDLSLLLESTPGSEVHEIGSLINLKMNDEEWEVRDSALELLYVCTDLCFIKYPPFRQQLNKWSLVSEAARLAFQDPESYVQATALRVLGAAARVPAVWAQLRAQWAHVMDDLLWALQRGAASVRANACAVLCRVYQHGASQLGPQLGPLGPQLGPHMLSAALSDLHWEVQLSALRFWDEVIETLLTDQGMLDGSFPPVTFSKRSRKIVTLCAAEIQRRLTLVMDQLADAGALTVLVGLLAADRLEVAETAADVATRLVGILDKYQVTYSPTDETVNDLKIQVIEDEDEAMDVSPSPETITDDLLTTEHINLLTNIYERHMSIEPKPKIRPKIKLLKLASPNLFVNYVKSKDFKAIIEQKKQWKEGRRSMAEVLDDILGYEYNAEANSLDCC